MGIFNYLLNMEGDYILETSEFNFIKIKKEVTMLGFLFLIIYAPTSHIQLITSGMPS